MNIKKLIVPVGSLIIVIIALIIGVVLLNKPATNNAQTTTTQQPQPDSSFNARIKEADTAYRKGDYTTAIAALEQVRTSYQDQNKNREADEINDRIESIKALQKQQISNKYSEKTPAPIAE